MILLATTWIRAGRSNRESGIGRPLRLQGRGAVHHVIVRGNERKAIFRDDRDREEYLDRLDRYRARFHFSLYAYCLMTNHIHLAIEEDETSLSRIMHALQSSYTNWYNRRHRRVGHLFQGRFKSYLVDRERYLMALLRYIHENPVRAAMVGRAEEYPWSSDRYFRGSPAPSWLDLDRVLSMIGPTRSAAVARYRRLMGEPADPIYEQLPAIEGVVKGGEEFARPRLGKPRRVARPRMGWTAERVGRYVAELSDVGFEDLRKADQRRSESKTRIVAAYLGRALFAIPVAEFARLFRREQSGLLHGVLSLERRMAEDQGERHKVAVIERAIREAADLHA